MRNYLIYKLQYHLGVIATECASALPTSSCTRSCNPTEVFISQNIPHEYAIIYTHLIITYLTKTYISYIHITYTYISHIHLYHTYISHLHIYHIYHIYHTYTYISHIYITHIKSYEITLQKQSINNSTILQYMTYILTQFRFHF